MCITSALYFHNTEKAKNRLFGASFVMLTSASQHQAGVIQTEVC
jgi:hypothetical protein